MALVRYVVPALVGSLMWAARLAAQETGTVQGRVVDASTQEPISGVSIQTTGVGARRGVLTQDNGQYTLRGIPAGTVRLRAARIGYAPLEQDVPVTAGGMATLNFALQRRAVVLEEIVTTGYGTQRREAITGSIATIDPEAANKGAVTNVDQMIEGRVAGVQMVTNNGEPGAGVQIRIRGGTSISASNDPLYVVDGVPITNVATEPTKEPAEANSIGIGGDPEFARNPLNFLNPSDIASISILKDAAAAIYGSRAANGVVLIETKKRGQGMEYDGYVGIATPARTLNVLTGDQYRQFVQQQVALYQRDTTQGLAPTHLAALGTANTDWQNAVTRTSLTHNHNLSFSGGSAATLYRASLNYMDQQGVILNNGFQRLQGRLNGTHAAFDNRLRLGLNLTASRVNNRYIPYEVGGGFEGGVFQNVAVFNPTQPVRITDPATGLTTYYETGTGRQSVRNPVALTQQISDYGNTTRILGNANAAVDLASGLTGEVTVGVDRAGGLRQTYFPASSPVGAEWNGRARQATLDNTSKTLQTVLTYRNQIGTTHGIDFVGGYEFNENSTQGLTAESRGFLTDAFTFNNLSAGSQVITPTSYDELSRLVSFFGRANYSFRDRYYLTGVLRRDGSSAFGSGNKWATFPAISASWRISQEEFMRGSPISELRLRGGWGLQGNPGVSPYSSLLILQTQNDARYVFGDQVVVGVAPTRDPNPNLKWETTAQTNVAIDYGFLNNRFTGTAEYYVKNTRDLLLEVAVPEPAVVGTRIENIGKVRNRGFEFSLDALALTRQDLSWQAGLVFSAERNTVVDLGGRSYITTGGVSGQGQSGQTSERIIPGYPLGTFYGPVFVGINAKGQQLFKCSTPSASCVGGQTVTPTANDYAVIGNANPSFTLGVHSQLNWHKLDASFLINSEVGQDVFNNTALVYSTKGNALQDKNFLASALTDPTGIHEPAIFSSRWIERASFVRLQNVTVGYTLDLPQRLGTARSARVYVSGDNLILLTGYSGLDPEVHAGFNPSTTNLAARGIDYLSYPRARTITGGVRLAF